MSTAQLGVRLLAAAEEVSFDNFLTDLKTSLEFSRLPDTGIKEIDQLLELLLEPKPSQVSTTLADTETYDVLSYDNADRGDRTSRSATPGSAKGAFIELSAPSLSTEATDLCHLLTTKSIIAQEHGGKGGTVLWIDTESRFSGLRLHQVLRLHLAKNKPPLGVREQAQIAKEALKHVHLVSVQSSAQLLSTLKNISPYLLGESVGNGGGDDGDDDHDIPQHYSSHRTLSLIIIDSATAFYWSDRLDSELARLESPRGYQRGGNAQQNRSRDDTTAQILKQLKDLQATFGCTVIYTTNNSTFQVPVRNRHEVTSPTKSLASSSSSAAAAAAAAVARPSTNEVLDTVSERNDPPPPPPPENPILPTLSQWTLSSTLSLNLSRIKTPKYPTHMNLQDCMNDREKRTEIVQRNRVKVSLNELWLDRMVRDVDLRKRIDRLSDRDRDRGGFVVCCAVEGVDLEG